MSSTKYSSAQQQYSYYVQVRTGIGHVKLPDRTELTDVIQAKVITHQYLDSVHTAVAIYTSQYIRSTSYVDMRSTCRYDIGVSYVRTVVVLYASHRRTQASTLRGAKRDACCVGLLCGESKYLSPHVCYHHSSTHTHTHTNKHSGWLTSKHHSTTCSCLVNHITSIHVHATA